jgi:ubiquinone/menaquinone biosynthesis C-methylase UbiE
MTEGADRLARKRPQIESAEVRKSSGVFRKTDAGRGEDSSRASVDAQAHRAEAQWDSCARAYDEFLVTVSAYFADEAVRRAGVTRNVRVLDVAAGAGAFAGRAAMRGARVLSVDGSLPKPSLEDGNFDVVASLFGPMLLSAHDDGLRELGRVLRPGGQLVLSLVTSDLLRFGASSPQAIVMSDEQHVKGRLAKLGFVQVQVLVVRQAFTFARAESLGELLPVVTPAWAQLLRRLSPSEREHTLKVLAGDLRKRQGQGPFSITCEALLAVARKPAAAASVR